MLSRLPTVMKSHHIEGTKSMKFHHLSALMMESLTKNRVTVEGHKLVINKRSYTDDADEKNEEKREAKEIEKITMPGFTRPGTSNEENYFSNLTKEQIEELKKKRPPPPRDRKD